MATVKTFVEFYDSSEFVVRFGNTLYVLNQKLIIEIKEKIFFNVEKLLTLINELAIKNLCFCNF